MGSWGMLRRSVVRHGAVTSPLLARHMSTSFADMYRESVSSVPLEGGDPLVGHIVGQRRPRSTTSQFPILDFGLKSEAPFSRSEIPGRRAVGEAVCRNLVQLEDEFNEPSFDHDGKANLPSTLAARYRVLTSATSDKPHFVYGRLSAFKRGGASAKVLGIDAFSPRHHVLVIKKPGIGSFSPFYLLSMASSKRMGGSSALPGLEVHPVVSSYGGILFTLANLVGLDRAWEASGGGSAKERLAYLQLLLRVLQQKNLGVRAALPKHGQSSSLAGHSRPVSGSLPGSRRVSGDQRSSSPLPWLDRPEYPGVWLERHETRTAMAKPVRGRVATGAGSHALGRRPGARRAAAHPTFGGRPQMKDKRATAGSETGEETNRPSRGLDRAAS